jgi:hypothetical protein
MQATDGQLSAKCFHDSCQGRGWQEFKEAIGPPDPEHYDPPLHRAKSRKGPGQGTDDKVFELGPLRLHPDRPHKTPGGKIVAPVVIRKDDAVVDRVTINDSVSGRQNAAGLIAKHLTDEKDIGRIYEVVVAIIAHAVELLSASGGEDELLLADIIVRLVPEKWELAHRTDRGAWSEARGAEVTRSEFITYTPTWLLVECYAADDCPRDEKTGDVNRHSLIKAVKIELEVVWSDLMQELPRLVDAQDLNPDSEAAGKFHEAIVKLWTATRTFQVSKTVEGTSGESIAARASLVSRVRKQAESYLTAKVRPTKREKWRPAQEAFHAYWRPYESPDGEILILLAMRWDLTEQIGIDLPGVASQTHLTALGTRFGMIDPYPPATASLSGGKGRLAVLSKSLATELLEVPEESDDLGDAYEPGASDTGPLGAGVTEAGSGATETAPPSPNQQPPETPFDAPEAGSTAE